MKKFWLILLLFPFFLHAQESDVRTSSGRLWVGLVVAPEYSHRFAHATDVYGEHLMATTAGGERGKIAFRTGLSLDCELLPWLSFETGLQYANKGYRSVWTSEGVSLSGESLYGLSKYSVHYLSVPLKAKFYAWGRDFPLFFAAGFSPDFFLGSTLKVDGTKASVDSDGSVKARAVNLCGLLGVGTKYAVAPRLLLEAEVGFKSSMMPMNDEPLRRKLYSLGLDVRIYYDLSRR